MLKFDNCVPISRCPLVIVPQKAAQSGLALDLRGSGRVGVQCGEVRNAAKIPNCRLVVYPTMQDSDNSNPFPTSYLENSGRRENV